MLPACETPSSKYGNMGPFSPKENLLYHMQDSIEDCMERWGVPPLPYYFGSFDTNYIIFKNVRNFDFFFF
jgi:hypothetical protein